MEINDPWNKSCALVANVRRFVDERAQKFDLLCFARLIVCIVRGGQFSKVIAECDGTIALCITAFGICR